MKYGCIGERLGHSFSAEIHALLGNTDYQLRPLPPEEVDDFLTKRSFSAINVTIPYKETVLPYLFYADEAVRKIGAANTVVNRDGKLYGYNTDFFGMIALLRRLGLALTGKKVVILGTGGTSRTASAVAESLGAACVLRVGRSGKDGSLTYPELFARHTDAEILLNTTPVGMFPHAEECPVDLSAFPRLTGVADAVYNPLRTRLVTSALERGIPAGGGLYMLVCQAVRASEIFLDTTYPEGTAERVYRTVLSQRENIVLTGMPASGKSTVGKLLAKRLGRPFYDADACIEAHGRKISSVFAEDGEEGFRELESRVIREELAPLTGAVIATGGGSILRDENLRELRMNGKIFFLDRPPELLIPTADRPLASDAEAIRRRYRERIDRYRATADRQIPAAGRPEEVADAITEEWNT